MLVVFSTVAILFYFGPFGPVSRYRRLNRRELDYYSRLAHACDSVLRQHPHFTRHSEPVRAGELPLVWIDADNVVWNQIQLSPHDSSLPDIVQELHADEISLAPNRVFIGFGVGRAAWSFLWEQDERQTNNWTLYSNAEGYKRILFIGAK
jgi:hypothetical protein